MLLLEIGRGSSYLAVHGPIIDPDLSEESRDQLQIELEWVAAVRRVVRDQLGKLLPLLDDDSPAVQAAVAGLAALFPDRSSSCVRQIEQLKAATSGPAAALYELVGVLLTQEPLPNDLLQRVAAADEEVADSLNYVRETNARLDKQVDHVVSYLAERAVVQSLDS